MCIFLLLCALDVYSVEKGVSAAVCLQVAAVYNLEDAINLWFIVYIQALGHC